MSNTVTARTLQTIRIRDRRQTRRAPRGAIGFAPARLRTMPALPPERMIANDDLRQFLMSFTAFFTAAMLYLA